MIQWSRSNSGIKACWGLDLKGKKPDLFRTWNGDRPFISWMRRASPGPQHPWLDLTSVPPRTAVPSNRVRQGQKRDRRKKQRALTSARSTSIMTLMRRFSIYEKMIRPAHHPGLSPDLGRLLTWFTASTGDPFQPQGRHPAGHSRVQTPPPPEWIAPLRPPSIAAWPHCQLFPLGPVWSVRSTGDNPTADAGGEVVCFNG
jgi:hypothetical protein